VSDPLEQLKRALADRYTIEREIGSGGMATVYLAQDLRHGRQVAVKVLRPELASGIGADRFVREIRLAARLTHPHILPLFDSGEAGGFLYFVMPVVEGESLRDRIRKARQLPVDEARQIAMEIADALDYAHRHDVVHRDIKPENIMLHDGHAVVTDFGIGKAVTAAVEGPTAITQTGVTVGTPAYMAPEQAAGDEEIDGRLDLYSLGCVFYEMLTGEQPFTGATAQAVIAKRFSHTPPPVTDVREGVPADVSRAVGRLLARAPADRYATGSQVVSALRSGETAAQPTVDPDDKSVAVLPFANLSADPENEFFADGITEEIINALSQLPELRVAARTSSFAFKDKRGDLADVASKLKVSHVVEGSVRKAGNNIRITAQLVSVRDGSNMWSEKYDRKMDDIFAVQDEIAAAIANRLKVALVERPAGPLVRPSTRNLQAYELYLKGRTALNRRGLSLLEGRRLFERALELDPDYALAISGLQDADFLLDYYGVRRYVNRAAPLRVREVDADVAEANNSVGLHHAIYRHDWEAADTSFRRALEINPNYVQALCWYGICVLSGAQGRTSEAVTMIEKAVELDPLASYPRALLSWVLLAGGRNETAEHVASEAMARDQASSLPVLMDTIGLARCGRIDEAVELAEHGVLAFGRLPWAVANLALACSRAGDTGRAGLVCNELSARAAYDYVPAFPMATAYAAVGRMDEALTTLEQGREERDPTLWTLRLLEPDWFWGEPRFEALCARIDIAPCRL
jgi:serine/threonine protein kinase/tetratricopeptide (TPR) repeat protein